MNLIIMHRHESTKGDARKGLLQAAISSKPVADVVFRGFSRNALTFNKDNVVFAVPAEWGVERMGTGSRVVSYTDEAPDFRVLQKGASGTWLAVSNGRFVTQMNGRLLERVLADVEADVVAITARPELIAYHEKVRLTTGGVVAGFRRIYVDHAEPHPIPIPGDWPHHFFVRTRILGDPCINVALPQLFPALLRARHSNALRFAAFGVAGLAWDIETEDGLLNLCRTRLSLRRQPRSGWTTAHNGNQAAIADGVSMDAVLRGKVLIGENVRIGPKAIIVGPTVIADNVTIGQGATIYSSVVCSNVSVHSGQFLSNGILRESELHDKGPELSTGNGSRRAGLDATEVSGGQPFRMWPRYSYGGCFKRVFDIIFSAMVILVAIPIFPIIALAIKLTSRGPVFFKDTRQGLHGRSFNCLKFRTMLAGADKMQRRLRILNEADGPQFKMTDDPRISVIGGFLRDTYIDELPQFFNVLVGQMSIVGPRPSPEAENTLCPSWRDARLSVRPGVTGLWQICRTREPMRDFQEWIHYDTMYVRDLSLRMDLSICWRTAMRMFRNFVKQF
jgi:lipopolysaccharide/colanic/teichoic acid biosynthesis glycosyltransferase